MVYRYYPSPDPYRVLFGADIHNLFHSGFACPGYLHLDIKRFCMVYRDVVQMERKVPMAAACGLLLCVGHNLWPGGPVLVLDSDPEGTAPFVGFRMPEAWWEFCIKPHIISGLPDGISVRHHIPAVIARGLNHLMGLAPTTWPTSAPRPFDIDRLPDHATHFVN